MELMTLHLLFGKTVPQLLIAAWPKVGMTRGPDRLNVSLSRRWARVAGVSPTDVEVWEEMLFAQGFITRDGGVDPVVKAWLDRLAVARLPKDLRPKAKAEEPPK